MQLLLTNDDGIDAPGLAALAAALPAGIDYAVVAPRDHHSGCSHRLTTDAPLAVRQTAERRWAVAGTPADCVRLGLFALVPKTACVVSGINDGGNLGVDAFYSGTIAAAREAALHGVPAIAVSHYKRSGNRVDWPRAVTWVAPLIHRLLHERWIEGTFWSINLPDPPMAESNTRASNAAAAPEVVFCPLARPPLHLEYRQDGDEFHYATNYHHRQSEPTGDVAHCFAGRITVTRLAAFPLHHHDE